jgi:signal transduction histidine kinase
VRKGPNTRGGVSPVRRTPSGGAAAAGRSELTLEGLFEVWRISTSLDPDDLIHQIVPKLAGIAGADRVSVMRLDEREQVLSVHTAVGLPAATAERARVPLGDSISGWVAEHGQALLLPGPRVPPALTALLKREGIVSALCVPLKSRSGTIGVLNLTRLRGRPFTQRHLWFTALLGERLASSIEVARLFTEREHLQAQLVQSAKMASLGVMASGIAHELRNPMAIASAAAQLLRDRPDDAALRAEALEKIYRSTMRASGIIESLLKFARPVDGPPAPVDINDLLRETCALMNEQMTAHHVTVKTQLIAGLPAVEADGRLLQQVFTNLMLNAQQAMPDGGTLSVTTATDERGRIVIRFADTGIGINPDHLPKVFDPFFTTRPTGQGIGLGLAISYQIIERHHGTIELASSRGKGTTATIRLAAAPRRRGVAARDSDPSTGARSA